MCVKRISTLLVIAVILFITSLAVGQNSKQDNKLSAMPSNYSNKSSVGMAAEIPIKFSERIPPPNYIPKKPGHYTRTDWSAAIDATWGPGLPDATKQNIFEAYWHYLDIKFACFNNLSDPGDWDLIYDQYHPELVAGGISKGRFSAILSNASMNLREGHTWGRDFDVIGTALAPGVPLMHIGAWGDVGHFGAGVTVLPDGSMPVYKVAESHPLNLEPGDLILGYDGIPWADIYPELLAAELPQTGWNWGSTDKAFEHQMLMSVGMNWHLFDVIDIEKYGTREIVHLPTSLLAGQNMELLATEQLEIPGVQIADNYSTTENVTYGVVDGTNIGYIYVASVIGTAETEFYNAIWNLMGVINASGIIIDFRCNQGGYPYLLYNGFELLFNETVEPFGFDKRCGHWDRLAMCTDTLPSEGYPLEGHPGTYFDKPIAMLIGPGCISAGDMTAIALSYHPRVKYFGKTSRTACTWAPYTNIHSDFLLRCAEHSLYPAGNPGFYATGEEFPGEGYPWINFEEVWLTREGVAQGRDDVAEAAMNWIISFDLDQDGIANEDDNCPETENPEQIDSDDDTVGDACDNCIDIPNPDQSDTDDDGTGDVCEYVCGDPNHDELINILDIVFLINYKYKEGPAPEFMESSDVNNDTLINILDIVYLINFKYKSGPDPDCP